MQYPAEGIRWYYVYRMLFKMGCALAQVLEEALHYEPEGLIEWKFPMTPTWNRTSDSASNKNEYQGHLLGGRCVGLTTLPPSCADCLEILESYSSYIPRELFRILQGYACLHLLHMILRCWAIIGPCKFTSNLPHMGYSSDFYLCFEFPNIKIHNIFLV